MSIEPEAVALVVTLYNTYGFVLFGVFLGRVVGFFWRKGNYIRKYFPLKCQWFFKELVNELV